ncbi:MAG: LPS export ABC transporter periplasmic protein LptC [Mariprofundales bacterium]
MKFGVLLAVIVVLGVAAGLWIKPMFPKKQSVIDSSMQANQFRYTELNHGKVIYHLSGEKMHEEAGRLGDLRVAALRVIKLENVQLELLQPKVSGWMLTAEHGELMAGNRQLSLWGNVHGQRKRGESFRAGRLLVDPQSGSVQLQDGFVLDVGDRHERGIATKLNQ